jgi:uncharacterized protein
MTDIDLPAVIPVFPLGGSILLPRATLPLNIFEPRYLAMVRDCMAGNRLLGIIQPKGDWRADHPPLFAIGGVGRITQFSETGDGRFLVAINGLVRFRVTRELSTTTPYRQVEADYTAFAGDMASPDALAPAARAALEFSLRSYLDAQGMSADWEAIADADDESLVHTLCSVCPFDAVERQALVEAADLGARTATLTALMAFADGQDSPPTLQ